MKVPEPRKLSSGNYFIQLRLNGQSIPITAETATECKNIAELTKAEYRAGKKAIKKLPKKGGCQAVSCLALYYEKVLTKRESFVFCFCYGFSI